MPRPNRRVPCTTECMQDLQQVPNLLPRIRRVCTPTNQALRSIHKISRHRTCRCVPLCRCVAMAPLMPVWRLALDGFGQFGGVQFFGLERECGAPQLSTIFLADQKCDTFAPSRWQPHGWTRAVGTEESSICNGVCTTEQTDACTTSTVRYDPHDSNHRSRYKPDFNQRRSCSSRPKP